MQAALAGLVGWAFGKYGAEGLPTWAIALSTVFVCCTVLGFGMSWWVALGVCYTVQKVAWQGFPAMLA